MWDVVRFMHTSHMMSSVDEDDDYYMTMALKVAETALSVGEVPVGCVLVLKNHPSMPEGASAIISHGANQVNATRDATRHAEMVAIDRLLTLGASSDRLRLDLDACEEQNAGVDGSGFQFHREARHRHWVDKWVNVAGDANHWKNKFGWRNIGNEELTSRNVLQHCDLFVTCEPCIMCGKYITFLQNLIGK